MKGQIRIQRLYAFIVVDTDGTEGIPAWETSTGLMMPLIGSDMTRIEDLKRKVATDPTLSRLSMEIAQFTHRESVERIGPPRVGH